MKKPLNNSFYNQEKFAEQNINIQFPFNDPIVKLIVI